MALTNNKNNFTSEHQRHRLTKVYSASLGRKKAVKSTVVNAFTASFKEPSEMEKP